MAIMDFLKPLITAGGRGVGTAVGGPIGGELGATAGSMFGNMIGGQPQQQQPSYAPQQSMGGMPMQEYPGGAMGVQVPRFTPEQMGGYRQLLQQGLTGMQQSPSADFGPIEDMYKSQFQQQTIPSIMERFSGMGAGGQRSSAFEQALGGAGAGLNQQLAGMRQQFNMQNRDQLMNMIQMGLQPQFQTDTITPPESFLASMGPGIAQTLGAGAKALGGYYMNKYMNPEQETQAPPAAQPNRNTSTIANWLMQKYLQGKAQPQIGQG